MSQEGRRGNWLQTIKGRQFWPLDPRPGDFDIDEIAHALAMVCRFGGHCRQFYSVAEHSVYVSMVCEPVDAMAGLMHDATEAYLGDMVRPLKISMPEYKDVENRMWAALAEQFGLPAEIPRSVKIADERLLQTEARDILAPAPMPWGNPQGVPATPADLRIECWLPDNARREFLNRWFYLRRGTAGPEPGC